MFEQKQFYLSYILISGDRYMKRTVKEDDRAFAYVEAQSQWGFRRKDMTGDWNLNIAR